MVNHILRRGNCFKLEKVSYKAWQKRFGRSVQFRAPGAFVEHLRRKAASAGGEVIEFPTQTTRLSQVCLCGAVRKKSLSERWHQCECGILMQRDLFSGFLAKCAEDNLLNADKAREIWSGLEPVLWAAVSSIKSVNGQAELPASVGLAKLVGIYPASQVEGQRQNGSPRKPDGINAKSQEDFPLLKTAL